MLFVNTPSAKADDFELRLKTGLVRPIYSWRLGFKFKCASYFLHGEAK